MRVLSLMLWPFRLVGAFIRLVFPPLLILAAVYGLFALFDVAAGWFVLAVLVVGVYLLVVVRVWSRVVVGSLRSMARGTVTVRDYGRSAGRRRGGLR